MIPQEDGAPIEITGFSSFLKDESRCLLLPAKHHRAQIYVQLELIDKQAAPEIYPDRPVRAQINGALTLSRVT